MNDVIDRIEDPEVLMGHLADFIGTSAYHAYNWGLTLTDGVKFFADAAGAYWLLDIIGTEVAAAAVEAGEEFIVVRAVSHDHQAYLTADDGNGTVFWSRQIDFTDLPEGTWSIWLIDGVLLLPSEY